jgi:hypothetical protein
MNPQSFRLAIQFSRLIREELTPDELAQVIERNKTYSSDVCATHDFIDSNETMAAAYKIVTGREVNTNNDKTISIWNEAWSYAKQHNFNL